MNYWPIFDIARRVLLPIPDPAAGPFCELLASTAQDLAGAGAVEMQDLAGQMFGRLIVDRKFLGTYYTLPESATFLAELAVSRLDGRVDWSDGDAVTGLRIADLACGTGALLSAAYRRIATRVRRAGGDDEALHTAMMEDALIGADVMPAAAHLATTMLSAAHPAVPFANCGIHVVPYGASADGKAVKLGSLDLLEGGDTMSLFGREAIRLAGHAGQISRGESVLHVDHGTLDMCIMNPPFPRSTNHEMTDMPVPSFAGFNTPEAEQKLMAKRLKTIYSTLAGPQARDGNAGPASHFLDLAHRKLKPGGILALVVPATITAGAGWAEGRDLIDCHYNDVLVATLSELTQGSTSRAFSADTNMADVLVVATKNPTTRAQSGAQSASDATRPSGAGRATYVALRERPSELIESIEIAGSCIAAARQVEVGTPEYLSFGDKEVGWLGDMPFGKKATGHPAGVVSAELASRLRGSCEASSTCQESRRHYCL